MGLSLNKLTPSQRQLYKDREKGCSVCDGTGFVSSDRAYYSNDPDTTVNNLKTLRQHHGSITRVYIPARHKEEVYIRFADGNEYIVGSFLVGYKGTRPSNFKVFLDWAGFSISYDEIEAMNPPVIIEPGFGPPDKTQGTGPTLEEAKTNASSKIPIDSKIVTMNITDDGNPQEVIGDGSTLAGAKESAIRKLPSGAILDKEEIVRYESKIDYLCLYAFSSIQAERRAEKNLSEGSVLEGDPLIIKRYGLLNKYKCKAYTPAQVKIKYHTPITVEVTFLCKKSTEIKNSQLSIFNHSNDS